MNFLQPLILGALIFSAIPVIIHLINKRRHRTIQWAAMMFLIQASRESRGKRKLRNIIILACRVLALAALIMAIARPIAGGWLGWAGTSQPDTIILVFDRSPSMELVDNPGEPSKRQRAIERVARSIREFADGAKIVLIDSASQSPVTLGGNVRIEDLPQTQASDRAADIPTLLSAAHSYLASAKPDNAEVWIVSDMQTSNWHPGTGIWSALDESFSALPSHVPVRVLALTSSVTGDTPNTSAAVTRVERHDNTLTVDLALTNNGSKTVEVPLRMTIGDGSPSQQSLHLPPGTTNVRKRIDIDASETSAGWGHIELPTDPNPRDNHAWFVYPDTSPLRTVVVAEPGSAGDRLAMAAAPSALVSRAVERIAAQDWQSIDWSTTSLVVWQGASPSDPAFHGTVQTYIQQGGQLAIFPANSPTPGGASTSDLMGVRFAENEPAPADQQFVVSEWIHNTGVLADFEDGTPAALDKLTIIRRSPVSFEGATATALYSDDQPFALTKRIGAGAVTVFTTLPDERWSDLLHQNVLFPALQRMIVEGSSKVGGTRLVNVGDKLPGAIDTRWASAAPTAPPSATPADNAGIYRDPDQRFLIAANIPHSESDVDVMASDEVSELFELTGIRVFEERVNRESDLASPVWRAFAICVLLFLLTEGILSLPPSQRQSANASTN